MDNINIVVCEILYEDKLSREIVSVLGKVYLSEIENFTTNMNRYICPISTNYIIAKDDIKDIKLYKEIENPFEFITRRSSFQNKNKERSKVPAF
jgi:hypothetical protein